MKLIAVFEHDRQGEGTKKGGWWGTNGYTDSIVYIGDYTLSVEELQIIAPYNEVGADPWFVESPTHWFDFERDEISKERTKKLVQELGSDFVEANTIDNLVPIMESSYREAFLEIKEKITARAEFEAEVEKEWKLLKDEQSRLLGQFLSKIDVLLYSQHLNEEQDKVLYAFKDKQYKFLQRNIKNHYFDLNKKIEIRFLFLKETCGQLKFKIHRLCDTFVKESFEEVRIPYREGGVFFSSSYSGGLAREVLKTKETPLVTIELYPLDIALFFNDLDYYETLQSLGAKESEYAELFLELKRKENQKRILR